MVKEVTILGRGPSRIGLQPSGDLWAMNDLYKFQPGIDCLFLLHSLKYHTGRTDIDVKTGGDINEAKKLGIPRIIGVEEVKEHGIEAYPMMGIIEEFGVKEYYTDTIDYMIAMAIYEGYKKINLVGCDYLPQDRLHANSKDSSLFWMGVAVGRKVDISTTNLSTLCKLLPGQSGNYMYDTIGTPPPELMINGKPLEENEPIPIYDAEGNLKAILKDKGVQIGQSFY